MRDWDMSQQIENTIKHAEMRKMLMQHTRPHMSENSEDPDQEAKADRGKLELMLCPREIIRAITRVRMYGTRKYKDPENWRKVQAYRYKNAMLRHLMHYLDDEDSVDPESGLPHIEHVACNLAFLIEFKKRNKEGSNGKTPAAK